MQVFKIINLFTNKIISSMRKSFLILRNLRVFTFLKKKIICNDLIYFVPITFFVVVVFIIGFVVRNLM